jgi:hypothetical protein
MRADFALRGDMYREVRRSLPYLRDMVMTSSLILISGCQDAQVSMDTGTNGVFTLGVLAAWNQGGFRGDYHSFYETILQEMSGEEQTPNYDVLGEPNDSFLKQTPLTI